MQTTEEGASVVAIPSLREVKLLRERTQMAHAHTRVVVMSDAQAT